MSTLTTSATRNATYTQEYLDIIDSLGGDETGRRAARDYMERSSAKYHNEVIYSSYLPKFFDKATFDRLSDIARLTYSILGKVMNEYLHNPTYRKIFDYDQRLVDLILLPRNYDAILPFARVDLFLNEDTLDVTFCEFNADGSSGMNEIREVEQSIESSKPYEIFAAQHTINGCRNRMFEGWVDDFLRIYDSYEFKTAHPHVAIVDFLDYGITDEFKAYQPLFEARDVEFSVFDMRQLEFDGTHLTGKHAFVGRDDTRIDAIWRRCVTNDVMDNWEASQALIKAVRAGKVALIGSFAGHIVHDKQIFKALMRPETTHLLTAEERDFIEATIPYTTFLDATHVDLATVKAQPQRWIIKPTDEYACQGVFAGPDYTISEWSRIIDQHANGASGRPYLVQQFCQPFRTEALPFYGNEKDYTASPRMMNNLTGLYLCDGQLGGIYSRQGPEPIILGEYGGLTPATFWVDC